MHPYFETGWSRNLIYPKLGFDESYFIEHFNQSELVRKYISDEEMYSKIIDRYENRKVNENLFIMSISMQNHGGYATKYKNFEQNYYKIGRSYTDANQYFSLIRESDDALRDFVNYFASVDEPVEIVFFGDHQPSLNSNFYKLLNGKGLSGLTLKELEALYTVPFFIWTNYDTPEETVEITSLNFLSTMALQRAGIDLPPYNQFMADLMEVVPAINARGYYSLEKDRYLHVEDALGEELEWIRKYENLQYNGVFDKKHKSDIFFPYFED
jgi:phosphoglycerol transferase MdoB-like AlkP superfamily enzyme